MKLSFNSSYSINELIKAWKDEFPEIEWTPNAIFNFADSNKLTIFAKKISWPYRIWCFKANTPLVYRRENHLLLVETGELSLHDAQISTYKREIITNEDAINSIEADRFFNRKASSRSDTAEVFKDNKETFLNNEISSYNVYELTSREEEKIITKEAIQKRKEKLIKNEKRVHQSSEACDHLEFHIDGFGEFLYKRRCRIDRDINRPELDNVKMLSAPYALIKMNSLDGYDLDAKDYLSDRFSAPEHNYLYEELSIARNNNFNNKSSEQERLYNPLLAFPSHQVQVDYYAKVDKPDFYILRDDKEQAEEFIRELLNDAENCQSKEKQTSAINNKTLTSKLPTSYYYINDLVKKWSTTPNAIFNLAYNCKLALYATEIKFPYEVWTNISTYELIDTGNKTYKNFKDSYPELYLVEKGFIIFTNHKISHYFESEHNNEGIEDSDFLTKYMDEFNVGDAKIIREPIDKKTSDNNQRNIDELEDNDTFSDELLFICDDFNDRIKHSNNYKSEITTKDIELGVVSMLEELKQVQITTVSKIKPEDIYILAEDKEQAEKYLVPKRTKTQTQESKLKSSKKSPNTKKKLKGLPLSQLKAITELVNIIRGISVKHKEMTNSEVFPFNKRVLYEWLRYDNVKAFSGIKKFVAFESVWSEHSKHINLKVCRLKKGSLNQLELDDGKELLKTAKKTSLIKYLK